MTKPRNVRNFWVKARADGVNTVSQAGPAAKDGGMDIELFQRVNGEVVNVADILCRARDDGSLVVKIQIRKEAFGPGIVVTEEFSTGGEEVQILSHR